MRARSKWKLETNVSRNMATMAPWKCMFNYYTHTHTRPSISLSPTRNTLMHVDQGLITVTSWKGQLLLLRRAAAASAASLVRISIPAVGNASPSEWPRAVKAFLSHIPTSADLLTGQASAMTAWSSANTFSVSGLCKCVNDFTVKMSVYSIQNRWFQELSPYTGIKNRVAVATRLPFVEKTTVSKMMLPHQF